MGLTTSTASPAGSSVERDGDLAVGDADGAVAQRDPAAAQHRALPEALALAVPDRPEGLGIPATRTVPAHSISSGP